MTQAKRHRSLVGAVALASLFALVATACASSPPVASSPSPGVSAGSSPDLTSAPSHAAAATPLPTLASTTVDAIVAPPGAISFKLTEDAGPRFQPSQATAKTGKVVIFLQNVLNVDAGPFDHNFAIGPKLHVPLANSTFIHSEKSAVFTVNGLPAGTYTFWCQVSDHAAKGMVGTLTVTP